MNIYRAQILDHFKHPRLQGHLEKPDLTFRESNLLCGDIVELEIKFSQDKISHARFNAQGCVISTAATSLFAEYIQGRSVDEVLQLLPGDIYNLLGAQISTARARCALLPLKAAQQAIRGWLQNKNSTQESRYKKVRSEAWVSSRAG